MMAQSSMDSDRLSSAGISTHSSGTAGTLGGSVVGVRVGEPGHKRPDEDEYNLGPLPPMWEKAFTPSGEAYFIDHNTGTSHWLDPRLARVRKHSLGECGEDELPYGWERVTDERYGSYYVDHINRRTQYENPVLQARRLRAETIETDNTNGGPSNGATPTGELRGERFSLSLTKGTQGLGFTMIGAEGIPEIDGYLQIRSIVPHSPAWIDGALRPGDVVVGVGARGVRGLAHAQVAQIFQNIAPGTDVTLHLVRGYPLPFDSADPHTRVLSTRAVDAAPAHLTQLTRALRTRFNLDSPNNEEPSVDEPDSPVTSHSPSRRLLSRSFDLDELPSEQHQQPPRCPSADHLLSLATEPEGSGRELSLRLRRGAAGFGFTIADSVHGQRVKKVLDRSRCAGLREGDLLLSIGASDVRRAPHHAVVQVLKECPALSETTIRVWRRDAPARQPRSRSATRPSAAAAAAQQSGRSKTPTADQLPGQLDRQLERLNGMDDVEATYAIPEQKRERESLIDRRRRSSTPGGRLTLPTTVWTDHNHNNNNNGNHSNQWQPETWVDNANNNWEEGKWGNGWDRRWEGGSWEPATPTVSVDAGRYWRGGDAASDNGGFPEDGLHSPTTAAVSGIASAENASGRRSSQSLCAGERRLASPAARHDDTLQDNGHAHAHRMAEQRSVNSPSLEGELQHTAPYGGPYPQVSPGGDIDPEADVLVRLARGRAGFGFRIVGGTEDGSRVAVGYVVPGGPAAGLLRPGDLLTSVDGVALAGATHQRAVAHVCHAAAKGHVTLGVRHNRADIQPLGLPTHGHQPMINNETQMNAPYSLVHPAPLYPPHTRPQFSAPYSPSPNAGAWAPYDVTVTRGDGEGFGFVVISSTNKATSTIGQLIPNSPAARCGLLNVGDTILAINRTPIRNLPHPEVVALIKHSGAAVTLTVAPGPAAD